MVRQVDLQRGHGNVTVAQGVEIGSLACILFSAGRTNPVDRVATRVCRLENRFRLVTMTKARPAKSPDSLPWQVWHIDVEDGIRRQRVCRRARR